MEVTSTMPKQTVVCVWKKLCREGFDRGIQANAAYLSFIACWVGVPFQLSQRASRWSKAPTSLLELGEAFSAPHTPSQERREHLSVISQHSSWEQVRASFIYRLAVSCCKSLIDWDVLSPSAHTTGRPTASVGARSETILDISGREGKLIYTDLSNCRVGKSNSNGVYWIQDIESGAAMGSSLVSNFTQC